MKLPAIPNRKKAMVLPASETSMIGFLPKESEIFPQKGENINCTNEKAAKSTDICNVLAPNSLA